ncbi:hypothetical protein ACQEVZ_57310 [Dactylosporangium sp. CA-152071]
MTGSHTCVAPPCAEYGRRPSDGNVLAGPANAVSCVPDASTVPATP